jgi:hypothetical protein
MKLINGVLRPGKVLEVLENGKIKASAPGLFSKQDQDNLPPIMPFFEIMNPHANSFSTPKVNDEVWVLNMTDNPLQLYWFRKDDHVTNNTDLFAESGTENVEIICNRATGMTWATLYFSDGSGWVLKNDDSKLQIHPDGHIEIGMNWPSRTINIDSNAIHLGGSENEHPACYGDEVAKILIKICGILEATGMMAKVNPYTTHLSTVLSGAKNVADDIPGIMSGHIKID